MLLNFSEMKIQRLATNNTDPLVVSVNNTTQQFEKEWVGIVLPPEVLKGKGYCLLLLVASALIVS